MTNTALIVGAGPVGLTMATELARYCIVVRIVVACSAEGASKIADYLAALR
jgi:thioredoxin reductase